MTGPDWIARATVAARGLRAATRGEAGARHSIYVILLHDPRRRQAWGLYVGQTSRDPDWRFDQHKAGYKASSAVRRFGVRLLPELVEHLNPLRQWESIELEVALAEFFEKRRCRGWRAATERVACPCFGSPDLNTKRIQDSSLDPHRRCQCMSIRVEPEVDDGMDAGHLVCETSRRAE